MARLNERLVEEFLAVCGFPRFIEHGPFGSSIVQHETVEVNRNQFEIGTTSQNFRHHGFVLNGVDAAGGVHQLTTWNQQRGPPHRNVHLHGEHLAAFFWCPIPPDVSVFSTRCRARARNIGHHDIEPGRW